MQKFKAEPNNNQALTVVLVQHECPRYRCPARRPSSLARFRRCCCSAAAFCAFVLLVGASIALANDGLSDYAASR